MCQSNGDVEAARVVVSKAFDKISASGFRINSNTLFRTSNLKMGNASEKRSNGPRNEIFNAGN